MKLAQALKKYLVHIRLNDGKGEKTTSAYHSDLNQYIAWLEKQGIEDTDDITGSMIEEFIALQSLEKSSASIVRMAASVRSFHHDLAFMNDVNDPSLNLEVHKGPRTLPVYCTPEEIEKLMNSFDHHDPVQLLDHVLLETIYSCGLRVSELTGLTMNRVDLDTMKLRVLGKGDKERIVPIPSGAIPLLKEYRDIIRPVWVKQKTNLFFINRFGRKVTSRYVEQLLQKKCVELNFDKHITPHKLRHSYATHMLQGGADLRSIQEILGHANVSTTEIYTHIQNKQMFDAYHKFHPANMSSLDLNPKKKD